MMFDTEQEYKDEITLVNTAIRNIMLLGQNYEIKSADSTRVFEAADIDKLTSYRNSLQNNLKSFKGVSGFQGGF